ncbi:hypothetical protein [Streptomyces rishiriensis]|uniref:hypothetical protein n=1 Tax=Streptomyces rishiriensis TaxID=68264 RepID=UPI0037D36B8A
MTEQTPEQPHPAVLELARVRAGLAAGLTVEQSARLQGSTDEELTADASAFAQELGTSSPAPQAPRSGGNQGTDVATVGAGSVAAGAELYRERHGVLDDERPPAPTSGSNQFAIRTYTMNGR